MRVKKWMLASFLIPCMLLFGFIYLAPMVMVFVSSFFEWKAGGFFRFIGIQNYIDAFRDARMNTAMANTVIWVLLQSVVHVGLGTVIAFMLSRQVRGWKVLRTIYMIPNVISAAALGVIFLNVFNAKYGLVNSFLTKLLGRPFDKGWFFEADTAFMTVTWSWLLYTGLIVIIVLAGILSVPEDVIDAARIDGASEMAVNLRIRLPLIRTIMGTGVVLAATSMLREFELIYLTTNGGPGNITLNLPLYLYKTSMIDNNYGYANMMGVVLIVSGIVVVYLINRLFRMDQADY